MSYDRRYTIVGSAFVTQGVVIGGMFAYGIFFPFLEAEFGWSRTFLSSCFSFAVVAMGVFAIGGGHLIDRFGPRWILSVTGLITGIGYVLMSTLAEQWQLLIYFGLFIGIGMSTHDVGTLSIVARVFDKRRGLMSGVVKVGTACGQMTIPVGVTALIAAYDWRTALVVLGVGSSVILIVAAQGLDPARVIAAQAAEKAHAQPKAEIYFRQALRTREFWTLCAAQFSFLPALITVPVHLPVHGVDLGMSVTGAAALLTVIGGASVAGRLGVGRTVDWIGGRAAMLISFAILAVSLAVFGFVQDPNLLYVVAAIYGFAHGGFFTVMAPTVAEYFGMLSHGAIFGSVVFCGTIGAAIGPIAAGRVYDLTQDYSPAFWGLSALSVVGLALVASLRRSQL
jgi:MFS family permease